MGYVSVCWDNEIYYYPNYHHQRHCGFYLLSDEIRNYVRYDCLPFFLPFLFVCRLCGTATAYTYQELKATLPSRFSHIECSISRRKMRIWKRLRYSDNFPVSLRNASHTTITKPATTTAKKTVQSRANEFNKTHTYSRQKADIHFKSIEIIRTEYNL